MSALAKLSVLFASLLIASLALSKEPLTHAQKIAALIDPAKLSTLAPRGANPRVQKYVAQLFEAQQAGLDPVRCAAEAAAAISASPMSMAKWCGRSWRERLATTHDKQWRRSLRQFLPRP
jgi:hypothetical protein